MEPLETRGRAPNNTVVDESLIKDPGEIPYGIYSEENFGGSHIEIVIGIYTRTSGEPPLGLCDGSHNFLIAS